MDSKTFFDNFESIANAPGGIARLRELILDLAVHGKLSRKHTADKPISTLVSDLQNDLVPYGEMSEIRFNIPNHWTWLPLASVVNHQLGKMLNTSKMKGIERPYLRSVNVRQDGNIDLTDVKRMLIPEPELVKYDVRLGDIFVNEGGDVGRNAIWLIQSDQEFAFQNQLHRLRPVCGVESRYVQFVLRHAKSSGVIAAMSSGVTIQHFSASAIRKLAFPLPPVEEQKRIVTKVDELMALCDELEAAHQKRNSIRTAARKSAIDAISTASTAEELDVAWKRISNNWITIADTPESISSLRSLILGLAVRGSLDSSEVGAHQVPINVDLEKLKLDEDKLWKLSTALPEPAQGWSRVPMARLGQWGSGGTPTASRKEYYSNGTIPWAVIGDLNSSVMLTTESLITQKALEASSTKMIPIGAVLVAMYGASIGKSAISGIECCTNQAIAHCVVDEDVITSDYLFLVIKSLKDHLIEMGKGAAQPNISQSVLKHLVIDIPPLSVQKRVIERTDELLDLCNQIETSLVAKNILEEAIAKTLTRRIAA